MNIKFKEIEAQGFRSLDRVKIKLDEQGIVIVTGVNNYEDKATSNGSGKSSIFEAIVYALFEETSSGEKDIENRILSNGFTVVLNFEINGDNYVIQRNGKNNKSTVILYKDGVDISARNKTDTNKLILNILGINKSIFLDSIFLSQSANTNLASLQPTARRERLEILSNTDASVNEFKEKIKQTQLMFEAKCVDNQTNINRLTGTMESYKNQKNTIQNKIDIANAEIERLKQLGDIKTIEQNIEDNNIKVTALQEDVANKTKLIETEELKINNIRKDGECSVNEKIVLVQQSSEKLTECNTIRSSINSINNDIGFINQTINRLNQEIENIRNSDKCPTCGRKYDNANEEHITKTISEKQTQIETEQTKIKTQQDEISKLEGNYVQTQNEYNTINNKITDIQKLIDNNKQLIDNEELVRRQIISEQDNIRNLIQDIQKQNQELQNKKEVLLKTETNNIKEYEDIIQQINKDVSNTEEELVKINKEYEINNNFVSTTKHILQLITKEFRAYLLQNSLKFLNILLQKYSSQLFSNESDVVRIKESDSKLDITLGSATYESLSGGEKTRVNIALLLAQKSLANSIGNITCNIIILDEVLGYCDSHAESNVVDLITKELDSLESIYMISHKEIPIGYDSELVIIKDISGLSRLKI